MCRACRAVEEAEKPYMYNIYIARATEFFGVTRTREIYEQAISTLPEKFIVRQPPFVKPVLCTNTLVYCCFRALQKDICLKYADLEKRLGEIDRARAIYVHTSQYCNPTEDSDFWKKWNDFEVSIPCSFHLPRLTLLKLRMPVTKIQLPLGPPR